MSPGAAMRPSTVVHLNVADFQAAVAVAGDRSLAGRPFVLAGAQGTGRAVVLGLSPLARAEGLAVGMPLSAAERRVRGLMGLADRKSVV